jgi:hypothetical protein
MALDALLLVKKSTSSTLSLRLRQASGAHGYHPIDGLLTALAIGSDLPLPSRWLPVVWGSKRTRSSSRLNRRTE